MIAQNCCKQIRLRQILRATIIIVVSFLGTSTALNAQSTNITPQPVYSVTSVAAMRQLGSKYADLHMVGYHEGSKRGGGYFSWDASSTATADNCTIFIGQSSTGRWIRQMPDSRLDVTMCGAKWDGTSDDAPAINAAFTVASRSGLSVSCPGGTGRIASTIAPTSFEGVIFKCQGMAASTLICATSKKPCFLFQNTSGTAEIQAPQIYDLGIVSGPAPSHPSVMIQYNSIAGGFADSQATQSYMMRPIVQRVRLSGGDVGIQCSKCFDGDISLNFLIGQDSYGIDLEGADWMGIGTAGTNRIVSSGDYPIKLVARGTFGNGISVSHNDILSPKAGVKAYIYSSARTSYIEKNFLEGHTAGACEILIDGALHVTVRDNHVTDSSVANWLCVTSRLAQGEFTNNQTTSYGQGPARFDAGRGAYNSVLMQTIVHSGNWSESGFP